MLLFYFGDWVEALSFVMCSCCPSFLGREVASRGVSSEVTTLLWRGDGVASTRAVAEVGALHVYKDERGELSRVGPIPCPTIPRPDREGSTVPVYPIPLIG